MRAVPEVPFAFANAEFTGRPGERKKRSANGTAREVLAAALPRVRQRRALALADYRGYGDCRGLCAAWAALIPPGGAMIM